LLWVLPPPLPLPVPLPVPLPLPLLFRRPIRPTVLTLMVIRT
jgi:hypothetical protein